MKTKTKYLLIIAAIIVFAVLNYNMYRQGYDWWQVIGFSVLILILLLACWISIKVNEAIKECGAWEEYE